MLEGLTYDGPWPDRIEAFSVRALTSANLGNVDAALRTTKADDIGAR